MRIGAPKEIKAQERRVSLVPHAAAELARLGHDVLIETGAGIGIGASDEAYAAAGCRIAPDAEAVFEAAELIVKVKEPQPHEVARMRAGQSLFTYLHLAAAPEIARALQQSNVTAIAYETVTDDTGRLPLLAPMSEIAGRMAVQVGAALLETPRGGPGLLLGGAPGAAAAHVVILGAGTAGSNAAQIAMGMRARVTVMDTDLARLRQLDREFEGRLETLYATPGTVETVLRTADMVVGAVLVAGEAAPRLVTRAMLADLKRGAVLIDVSIDQGGCFETSRPTTHDDPTFVIDGVTHYCVANMPGAVARTSAYALGNATLPFVIALADNGVSSALNRNAHLRAGLNVADGKIVHKAVARALGVEARTPAWLT